MRKLLLVSAFLVACGSSSKNSSGPPVSGTIGGHAFSPADVQAIQAGTGSTPCPVPLGNTTVNVGIKALAILLTSYPNSCGDFATAQCKLHQNAQSVTIIFARLNPLGTEPPLAPGTFTVNDSPATVTPDGSGMLVVAFAQALSTNATCVGTPSSSIKGGTLRLDQVTGPITGHVDVTFADGSTLSGDFSAPICPGVSPDVCSLATTQQLCTLPPACVP